MLILVHCSHAHSVQNEIEHRKTLKTTSCQCDDIVLYKGTDIDRFGAWVDYYVVTLMTFGFEREFQCN